MKKYFFCYFLLLPLWAAAQSTISLEDLWVNYRFYPKNIDDLRSMNDGNYYTLNENGTAIVRYAYADGKKIGDVFNVNQTNGIITKFKDYHFNADETAILLTISSEPKYRYSTYDENYVYDIRTRTTTKLSDAGKQMYADFAPKGNRVAYVIDNNLYYKDLDNNIEYAITTDGKWNSIINGGSDWVYEEELSLLRAFAWSPDGSKIAYYRFDESAVPQFDMTMYKGALYPSNYSFKYPKVGEPNSKVEIYVYDLADRKTTKVNIAKSYEYIPRIKWTNDGSSLCVTTLNRLQNDLELFLADPATGNTRSLLRETAKYYLEITDDLTFLEDNQSFIWKSEQDGWFHLYRYDMQGKLINQITEGPFEVTEVLGVDEQNGLVYYISAEESDVERHLYSIQLDGKKKKKITTRAGVNKVVFNNDFSFFINTHSSALQPYYISLCDRNGKEIRVLEDNQVLAEDIKQLHIRAPEFMHIQTSTGVSLPAFMMKPYDFDPKKKYPVLMFVYGGANRQEVVNEYDGFRKMWHQMMTQKGYIVVCVDNRGTSYRGRDYRQVSYGQLGKFETDDQIEVAKWLAGQPYVDAGRIGIWGWSYGGYMASLCITRGADVFKTAMAVAPVTNWKYYDNIYTERYMGTMETNPNGFDDNSPIAYAHMLKGNFLLIHGTGDDNVHFQNTVELINAFVRNNKQFDLMVYPDRNHGISGGKTRLHLYTMMTDYVLEHL